MIINPHGWRKRYIAAKERAAGAVARRATNAARWAHYNKQKAGDVVPEPVVEKEAVVEGVKKDATDDMTNSDIRGALGEAGYEVPKNTARARLIELYEEHVEHKDG